MPKSKRASVIPSNLEVTFQGQPKNIADEHREILTGRASIKVVGDSMRPYYQPGDVLKCDGDLPRDGSMVVAKVGKTYAVAVCNRVDDRFWFGFVSPGFAGFSVPVKEAMIARVESMIRDETA